MVIVTGGGYLEPTVRQTLRGAQVSIWTWESGEAVRAKSERLAPPQVATRWPRCAARAAPAIRVCSSEQRREDAQLVAAHAQLLLEDKPAHALGAGRTVREPI